MERIETAVEYLKDGLPLRVDKLLLGMERPNVIYVTGSSNYSDISNLSRSKALEELDEVKQRFHEMVNSCENLKAFIFDKKIKYNLAMGGIGLCFEFDNNISWGSHLKFKDE